MPFWQQLGMETSTDLIEQGCSVNSKDQVKCSCIGRKQGSLKD